MIRPNGRAFRRLGVATLLGCLIALPAAAGGAGNGNGKGNNDNKPGSPGLAERVEVLEKQNARQQARIRQLLRRPNLAGKSCPAGLAVTGFNADGSLICGAPWTSTPPDPDPDPDPDPGATFSCIENYDEIAGAAALNAYLNSDLATYLASTELLRVDDSTNLGGLNVDYELVTHTWQQAGVFEATAPLIELAEQEPCADAIRATIRVPQFTVLGDAEIDLGLLSYTPDFQVVGNDVVLEALVRLSAPDLSGATVGASFDRDAISVSLAMVSGDINVELDGAGAEPLASILEFLIDTYEPEIRDRMLDAIEDQVGVYLLSTLPAPVTVQVVAGS